MGAPRRSRIVGGVDRFYLAGGNTCNAMNSFGEIVPTDDTFVGEVIGSRHYDLVKNGDDCLREIGSIGRRSDLIEDYAEFVSLFSKFKHSFYEVVAESGVEPCGTDNGGARTKAIDSCLTGKFCFAVYAIGTGCVGFNVRCVFGSVEHVICAYLYQLSVSFFYS